MRVPTLSEPITKSRGSAMRVADFIALTKPRLSSLVLATTAGGMWLAPGELGLGRALITLLATAGTVGAANALNCYIERDSDRFMARTANRPLPAKRMEPGSALWFGLALAALSVPVLALAVNGLTGALALLALLSYVLGYTLLKPRSSIAMWVGAIPGALPPLMGWTAVTGQIQLPGLVLFSILFFWQLPHFLAIALFRKEEYRRAGLQSVPLAHGDDVARLQVVVWLVPLLASSIMPYVLGVAGLGYLVAALALGLAFLALGLWGWIRRLGAPWAKQLFLYSLIYLSGLVAVLVLDGGPRA